MSKEVCLVSNAFKSLKTNIARALLVIVCTCSVSLKDKYMYAFNIRVILHSLNSDFGKNHIGSSDF